MTERKASTRNSSGKYLHLVSAFGVTVLLAGLCLFALNVRHSSLANSSPAPVERLLTQDGTVKLNTGFAGTLGALPNIPQANSWAALPNHGLNNRVVALAVMGNDLYVGGAFDKTADGSITNLNSIARYSNGTWSTLPNGGLNGQAAAGVDSLAVMGSDLYVGGDFNETGDGSVTNLGDCLAANGY